MGSSLAMAKIGHFETASTGFPIMGLPSARRKGVFPQAKRVSFRIRKEATFIRSFENPLYRFQKSVFKLRVRFQVAPF
ncbi:MAG: hypothetical protein LBS79_06930, partial [Tannerella sp.]|nr:hypothetical protein [Tannerella sp.]